jgi:hypothetical protein
MNPCLQFLALKFNHFDDLLVVLSLLFLVYFFGRLECVGHSFAYVAHFGVLRDV